MKETLSDLEFADRILSIGAALRDEVDSLKFSDPVAHVYNPLRYAWPMYEAYVRRFATGPRRVLLMGMNPGPWGMAQTGVPFGEIAVVRDWMQLDAPISRPEAEHPKRPVTGLACTRSEVSGRRLWGYFAEKFGSPESFFAEHFVLNYCPLVFLEDSGRNRTPDKLPAAETIPLFAACDRRLQKVVELFQPEWLVGVGGFAKKKLETLFGPGPKGKKGSPEPRKSEGPGLGVILHPSPASPAANRGWAEAAEKQFTEQGIWT